MNPFEGMSLFIERYINLGKRVISLPTLLLLFPSPLFQKHHNGTHFSPRLFIFSQHCTTHLAPAPDWGSK